MRIVIAIAALAAGCIAGQAFAATDAECQAMWKKADTGGTGVLSGPSAARYTAAMRVHDKQVSADGNVNQSSFLESCKSDVFELRKVDTGAPLKGSNSYTEGQAKDRAMAQGLMNVGELKKDADGIWRGSAAQDGKTIQVAVDYKGNVVTQATQ